MKAQFSSLALAFIVAVVSTNGQDVSLPDGRSSALLIYHPASKGLLLFDGYQIHPDSARNDVWKWDGKHWERMEVQGPESRNLSAGDLNRNTGNIQIFGGIGRGGYEKSTKGDSWSFNGRKWSSVQTNNIGTRDHHKMVYADHLNAFVLYGGQNSKREFDSTTWLLKGKQFIPLNIEGPGVRYHFGMAYDRSRKRIVLYGGGRASHRKELWEFDGNLWVKINTPEGPGAKLRHNLVYADHLKMVVLHGGYELTNGWTWGWDGKNWRKIAENGPKGDLQGLGYDPARKAIVAYGGNDENGLLTSRLWELIDGEWKKISDNGFWRWHEDRFQRIDDKN